jgi:hypothetical protein
MRFFYALLSCALLVASIIGITIGWYWHRMGMQFQTDYPNDWELNWEFRMLAHAINNFGITLECLGGIGVLASIMLFIALEQLSASLRRLHRLEGEVEWLHRALPSLPIPPSSSFIEKTGDEFFSKE